MSRPRIAFVESNTSGTGRLFLAAARELGFQPIMLTSAPERYPFLSAEDCDVVTLDTGDTAALVEVSRELSRKGLAGVTSSSEYFVVAAARVAWQLGLPGPDPVALASCRDKHLQRQRLRAAGVAIPDFRAAETPEDAVRAAEAFGFPVIVKPVSGSGSVGVAACSSPEGVHAHAAALLGQAVNERGQPVPRMVLVETIAQGPEYSVETFDRTVVGVTAKHLGSPPYFIEVGHDHPAPLHTVERDALARITRAALDALGLGFGPAHTEIRYTESGPAIIEVNPRLAGGFIPELVRLATGVDLVRNTVARIARQPAPCEPLHRRHASLRFLLPPAEGSLARIDGLEAAGRLRGVAEARMYGAVGSQLACRHDFRDRIGHVIATGATPEDAMATADRAREQVRLTVTPARGA
ncbi:ATP-grasp domain-containing protein [Pendulispora rubella]|uniref:ATP-grasp domain-containing protein n=1 Tax=Pendulispora rubella TaxID=2741070 RepID=A0ABZ2LHA2_9BACT